MATKNNTQNSLLTMAFTPNNGRPNTTRNAKITTHKTEWVECKLSENYSQDRVGWAVGLV